MFHYLRITLALLRAEHKYLRITGGRTFDILALKIQTGSFGIQNVQGCVLAWEEAWSFKWRQQWSGKACNRVNNYYYRYHCINIYTGQTRHASPLKKNTSQQQQGKHPIFVHINLWPQKEWWRKCQPADNVPEIRKNLQICLVWPACACLLTHETLRADEVVQFPQCC